MVAEIRVKMVGPHKLRTSSEYSYISMPWILCALCFMLGLVWLDGLVWQDEGRLLVCASWGIIIEIGPALLSEEDLSIMEGGNLCLPSDSAKSAPARLLKSLKEGTLPMSFSPTFLESRS